MEDRTREKRFEYLERILRSAADGILSTDLAGRVVEFSGGAESVFQRRGEEVRGRLVEELFAEPDAFRRLLARCLAGETHTDLEVEARESQGARLAISISLAPLRESDGSVSGVVAIARDNQHQRELKKELLRRSITDRLTGLYNQTHFYEVLETEKERSDRLRHDLSLVLIDLDGFKGTNDQHGHLEGDSVIRKIASVLFESIRKEVDSAFRYGGDEFVVLCPGLDEAGAVRFAERIRQRIEHADLFGVRASIGVCEYRDHDRTIQLVKEADAAMYRAKRAGGNCVCATSRLEPVERE